MFSMSGLLTRALCLAVDCADNSVCPCGRCCYCTCEVPAESEPNTCGTYTSGGGMDGAANYTITETDLTIPEPASGVPFGVTVSCASGFESPAGVTPAATACAVQNTLYSVSGCTGSADADALSNGYAFGSGAPLDALPLGPGGVTVLNSVALTPPGSNPTALVPGGVAFCNSITLSHPAPIASQGRGPGIWTTRSACSRRPSPTRTWP